MFLIADVVKFKPPKNIDNMYQYLAKIYYNDDSPEAIYDAKEESFEIMYGGKIKKKHLKYEFFQKIKNKIDKLYEFYKKNSYIESYMFKKRIYNIGSKYKILPYYIQNYETELNITTINLLNKILKNFKSKIILYEYDSLIFDLYDDEYEKLMKEIIPTLTYDGKFPVKLLRGNNLKEIKLVE